MVTLPVIGDSPVTVIPRDHTDHRLRVLLINPPRFSELIGKNPAIVEKHRGFNPPLGILSLAGYLEQHSPFHLQLIDAQPKGYSYSELEQLLCTQESADVVGITAMTFTLIDVFKTVRIIRRVTAPGRCRQAVHRQSRDRARPRQQTRTAVHRSRQSADAARGSVAGTPR